MTLDITHKTLYYSLTCLMNLLNKFKWQADGGLLLSTIRQHDFTPHDPDLDITMRQDEYDKWFKFILNKIDIIDPINWEYNKSIEFAYLPNIYNLMYGKFICYNTLLLHQNWIKDGYYYLAGPTIDVFPVNNIPDDPIERIQFVKKLISIRQEITKSWQECFYNKLITQSFKDLVKYFDELRRKYDHLNTIYCSNLSLCCNKNLNEWLRYNDSYNKLITQSFKNLNIPVSIDYTRVLVNQYGIDYTTSIGYIPFNIITSKTKTIKDVMDNPTLFKNLNMPIEYD